MTARRARRASANSRRGSEPGMWNGVRLEAGALGQDLALGFEPILAGIGMTPFGVAFFRNKVGAEGDFLRGGRWKREGAGLLFRRCALGRGCGNGTLFGSGLGRLR